MFCPIFMVDDFFCILNTITNTLACELSKEPFGKVVLATGGARSSDQHGGAKHKF